MTEPIKQEIINNIFENGDKLITGPILQTVLIDMIDDVNVKDQEILSKTGSWDDAATQIPNLATKAELTEAKDNLQANITNLSESVARDIANVSVPEGVATEAWVQSQGYLTEHQDISNLATKAEVTNLSESVARDLENVVDVDLTGYATEQWVQDQGYLTEHQDISNLATKTELTEAENNLQGNITSLSESVARDLANVSVPEGVATEAWVQSQDYASKTYVDNAVSSVDLTGYATETWVESQGYLKEHQDISNLATKGELNDTKNNLQGNITSLSESVARDLTGYATETWVQNQGYLKEHQDISGLATKTELTSVSQSVQTDITNLSESVANSAVWKKGEGTDSVVQVFSGDLESESTATELGAVAIGALNTASGVASHAEGIHTVASGQASHAEGNYTTASEESSHAEGYKTSATGRYGHAEGWETEASGVASHAEGIGTITHNAAEHAQGMFNHSPENQIFSVGAGDGYPDDPSTATRRNAISVLAVDNNGSYTSSFFVQNIGGYDGTNPTPGTNDLATVINGMSTGGGSSETLWEKGTGEDSLVQKLTGDNEANTPTATGTGAIATGRLTIASGFTSHAEGISTVASGSYSHAEGNHTTASGAWSHAEGFFTVASNGCEHAQGQYNHSSKNQIFSIGAGENVGGTVTRRNAISVLAVPNGLALTSSVFIQNIGGYDGTNPTPGTNDLATVISGLSSGGGSSETLWKKGTGQDSMVQKLTGDYEAYTSTATGIGAVAIGTATTASGEGSRAEGDSTTASGYGSHTEGQATAASGMYSHAEGAGTIAANRYEHAQGMFNHSSENQIFSVGAGEGEPYDLEIAERRNAISVLAVKNNSNGSHTASFFVQNIGGYDGTNPIPGTNDLATVINNLSSSVGSSSGGSSETLWKKGTGQDSIVQILTGVGNENNTPKATGAGAIAVGSQTTASGILSHAEGFSTEASGMYSHAEGQETIASNDYEHAQGRYNHNSENQIFSIGTGNNISDRRNVVSVLEVSNNNSYTGSFFVQNIGGYDGTNPIPGTNDLATVINGISTGGGIGTSSETWTFTLEDGSTVTKNIVMR